MTPQQLRNSILQLAIEGKLVEQRSEEGTGEELLKIIQEEKKELLKKGKIRKQKSLPQIKPDEVPFSIPNTWKWIRLGDVGDWGSGGTPLRTNPNYYGGDIPWLKTGDLTDGEVGAVSEYITDLALEKTSIRLNPTGSVLMAMYGATIGKLGILTRPMTTNQACCACIVYPNVFNKYLFYFLLASRNYFIKRGEGGAQPNISRAKIIETCMPLPPFEEQKRIVKKIEEIFPLVEWYGNAWEKLKELNQKFPNDLQKSILQEAIQGKLCEQKDEDGSAKELIEKISLEKERLIESGQIKKYKALPAIQEDEIPFDIPDSWRWERLGNISTYNQTKTKVKAIDLKESTWVLDLEDIEKNTGNILERINAKDKKVSGDKLVFYKGQLLYSKLRPYLKKILIAPDDGVCTPELVPFNILGGCNTNYILSVLKSPYVDFFINSVTYGVKMPRVSVETMVNLLIPIPTIKMQNNIAEMIDKVNPLCDKLRILIK